MTGRRRVRGLVELALGDHTEFALALAVAGDVPVGRESLVVRLDGREVATTEVPDAHGTRLHVFDAAAGLLRVEYTAEIVGRAAAAPVEPADAIRYLRPSRYVQSDALTPFARERFAPAPAAELLREVTAWVAGELDYRPEASVPTGGAVETLAARAGVCRDYAHLTAALLRALDVPARIASVYAPGLEPMDFHAVVEAFVDGRWLLADATRLAPRASMVRIATGRDAADVAFVTNTRADVELRALEVGADADERLVEDPAAVVELG